MPKTLRINETKEGISQRSLSDQKLCLHVDEGQNTRKRTTLKNTGVNAEKDTPQE